MRVSHQGRYELAAVSDLEPKPGGHSLQAPARQQLHVHKAAQALAIGHPQRQQSPFLRLEHADNGFFPQVCILSPRRPSHCKI